MVFFGLFTTANHGCSTINCGASAVSCRFIPSDHLETLYHFYFSYENLLIISDLGEDLITVVSIYYGFIECMKNRDAILNTQYLIPINPLYR